MTKSRKKVFIHYSLYNFAVLPIEKFSSWWHWNDENVFYNVLDDISNGLYESDV